MQQPHGIVQSEPKCMKRETPTKAEPGVDANAMGEPSTPAHRIAIDGGVTVKQECGVVH